MPELVSLVDIAKYHADADASLRSYFSATSPTYTLRFATYLQSEVTAELSGRIDETDLRSTLVLLARVEAALRRDYIARAQGKLPDKISIQFRKIHKQRGRKARLEEDILETWKNALERPEREIISQLKGMLKFRHWLAHGRYWNIGSNYRFQDAYIVADAVIANLPLIR